MSWRCYPPSPGDNVSFVTHGPIDAAALLAQVADPGLGGTALFVGSVRGGEGAGNADGPVDAIEYSAYEAVLEAEFGKIVTETTAQWPDARVVGLHRLGRIPAGDISIAIAAAAPHRAEAFAACRHAIEEAKKRLPVWKKEIFRDGSVAWKENDEWVSPSS